MKLNDLKNKFKTSLSNKYNSTEIEFIFFEIAEKIIGKEKKILRLALNENWSDFEEKKYLFYHYLTELESGKPLQYVLEEAFFFGNTFLINEHVLIPRPETEELIEWILTDFERNENSLKLLDIGTGSGCIAISLKKERPNWEISALDFSEKALTLANQNSFLLNAEINLFNFNLLEDNLNNLENLDIIVSNPPYIKKSELHLMDKSTINFEPHSALFVNDETPLIFYEKLIELSKLKLNKKGAIYVEINQYLAKETESLFKKYFKKVELRKDISKNYRMLKAEFYDY